MSLLKLKAQKLLDDILEKNIDIVSAPIHDFDNKSHLDQGGVRLFKHSPLGIVFAHVEEHQGPRKRPRLLPGKEIDEKSKEYRRQLQSVAVDGVDIVASAREACRKSLAIQEAKETEAKAVLKREEERVAELKKIRGERWLPSIAKEMQVDEFAQACSRKQKKVNSKVIRIPCVSTRFVRDKIILFFAYCS